MAIYGLLNANLAADGDTTAITLGSSDNDYVVVATGTWGSGTLTVKLSPDGGTTYYPISNKTLTADGIIEFKGKRGWLCKATLSSSTSPDLDITIA